MYRQAESEKLAICKVVHLSTPENGLYLTRYIFYRTPFGCLYLHHIHQPDPDRHLHNHPYAAKSYILHGGYTEIVQHPLSNSPQRRTHVQGETNVLAFNSFHRIVAVQPNTWTLVVCGRRRRRWSFLENGLSVDADTYLNRQPKRADLAAKFQNSK